MVRVNREYLDRGLGEISEYSRLKRDSQRAENSAVAAIAEASALRERARIAFREKIARAVAFFIILLGVGLFIYILAISFGRIYSAMSDQIVLPQQEEPGSRTPNGTTADQVTINDPPEITVQPEAQDEGTGLCYNDLSFNGRCDDEHVYPNGSVYVGEWLNGKPDGNGILTFAEGGAVEGIWSQGTLVEGSVESPQGRAPMMSVTVFASEPADHINPNFLTVVVGHNFNSSVDESWSNAYCYLTLIDGEDRVRVELSSFPTFDASILSFDYRSDHRYTEREFDRAQQICPYRRIGF